MSTGRPDPEAYALGMLEGDEHAHAAELERHDLAYAAEVARARVIVEELSMLDDEDWRHADPPPLRFVPEAPARSARRRRRGVLAVAVAAVAVAAVLVGAVLVARPAPEPPRTVAQAPTVARASLLPYGSGPATARGSVTMAEAGPRRRTVRLRVSGLPQAPAGHHYELWLLADEREQIAVGTFAVRGDGTAAAEYAVGVDPRRYPIVDVSLQRTDAGPSHSGDSVLRAVDS